jgi:zinc transporter 1/2/3
LSPANAESIAKYTEIEININVNGNSNGNGHGEYCHTSGSIEHETSASLGLEEAHHRQDVAQAWIFYVALALHAVFDGLSIGAEQSSNGFYGILIAVLVHKGLDGFTLGIPIYYANFSRRHTIVALVFSALMTPLGTAIGMGATSQFHGPSGDLGKH